MVKQDTSVATSLSPRERPMSLTEYGDGSAVLEIGNEKPWSLSAEELAALRGLLVLPLAKRGPL